jgi:hypothetical protein
MRRAIRETIENGNWSIHMITLDIIGTIYTPGEYDEEGNVIVAPTPLPGYHVNVSRLAPEIEAFAITSDHPTRLFAGVPTFFLKFADEAEYTATFYDTNDVLDEEGNPTGETTQTLKPFVTAEPPRVPFAISRAQGKAALVQAGMWDGVVAYVEAIVDPTQKKMAEIAINDTQYWVRNSDFLTNAGTALGLTTEQMDDLFIQAQTIHF